MFDHVPPYIFGRNWSEMKGNILRYIKKKNSLRLLLNFVYSFVKVHL